LEARRASISNELDVKKFAMLTVCFLDSAILGAYRAAPFESYHGNTSVGSDSIRLFLNWDPRDPSDLQPLSAKVHMQVARGEGSADALVPMHGLFLREPQLFFLVDSPSPSFDFSPLFLDHFRSLPSYSSANHSHLHRSIVRYHGPAISYLLTRCATSLIGTQINSTMQLLSVELTIYDFIDYQIRYRLLMCFCAVGFALMFFAVHHESLRWTYLCGESASFCFIGDVAIFCIFLLNLEEFDESSYFLLFMAIGCFGLFVKQFIPRLRLASSFDGQPFEASSFGWIPQVIFGCILFAQFPGVALFVRFGYWLPQICFSAVWNCQKSVDLRFAVIVSGGQLLFAGSFLRCHPKFNVSRAVIVSALLWIALQLAFMGLQGRFGGGFMLPIRYHRKRYNWRCEAVPEDVECVICMAKFTKRDDVLMTPCKHFFHETCMRRWIGVNPICPIDRSRLPPFDL
jgi:hypothetical protein